MTKFQRGELMEGWNDCPDIMMLASSSNSSIGSRLKRRTPRAYGANSPQDNVASNTLAVPKEYSEDELRRVKLSIEEYVKEGLFKDQDKEFVTERLVKTFDTLDRSHQQFVAQIAEAVISKLKKPGQLRTEVLTFMMANSGVSTWAVGLKKFVEMQ